MRLDEITRAPAWGEKNSPAAPRLDRLPAKIRDLPGHPGFVYRKNKSLAETGDSPYPVQPINSGDWINTVTSHDGRIEVEFLTRYGGNNTQVIDVSFTVDGVQEITGGGDAFRIFSTVRQIIQTHLPKLIKRLKPDGVWFHSHLSEPSRVKAYDRFAVPFFNQLLGNKWKFSRAIVDGDDGKDALYRWSKK